MCIQSVSHKQNSAFKLVYTWNEACMYLYKMILSIWNTWQHQILNSARYVMTAHKHFYANIIEDIHQAMQSITFAQLSN